MNSYPYILYKTIIDNIVTDFDIKSYYVFECVCEDNYIPKNYTDKIVTAAGVVVYIVDNSYNFPVDFIYPSFVIVVYENIYTTIVFHKGILFVDYLYDLFIRL